MYYIIVLFLSLLKISLSNVWDNIYTQAKSPHYVIADNFEIKLLNIEENITAGEILVSSELGLMKLSLILTEENEDDSFIQILLNFTEGKIYFDIQEKCLYKYFDMLKEITPKFILNGYDIFSYFDEDKNNYHYIVTNPLESPNTKDNRILFLAKEILNDFGTIFKKDKSIYDKDLYADFLVDKIEEKIKTIQIKSTYGFMKLNTEYKAYNITIDQFKGIHEPKDCTEYN